MNQPTSDPEPLVVPTRVGPIGCTDEGPRDARALLCLHGIPGSHRDFRYLAPQCSDAFRVVRINLPGFGNTEVSGRPSVAGWADVIGAVADALSLDRFLLAAHSFGGAALFEAADRWPRRIEGVVLLACPGARVHRAYGASAARYRRFARLASLPLSGAIIARIARRQYQRLGLKPPDRRLLAHQLRIIGSLDFAAIGRRAAVLSCPALLAHCEDDPLVQVAIARELASMIPQCHATFFPSGGHFLQKTRAVEIGALLRETFAPSEFDFADSPRVG